MWATLPRGLHLVAVSAWPPPGGRKCYFQLFVLRMLRSLQKPPRHAKHSGGQAIHLTKDGADRGPKRNRQWISNTDHLFI